MTLDELTPWLFSRVSGGVRWGLERTESLLAGVGNPHRRFRSLLIGGTNGKGSVAALCESALRAAGGARIGLYTSPHLVRFTERVRIEGAEVAASTLAAAAARLRPAIEASGATFFEATTAMAFFVFAEAEVELAVVEVGLGGRLDATNVLTPLVTTISNVDRDHQEYLGEGLARIAWEKAGIFKAGVPALAGVTEPELRAVMRGRAAEVGAPLTFLDEISAIDQVRTDGKGTRFRLRSAHWGERRLRIPLPGNFQARNAALAVETLGLLPEGVRPTWDAIRTGFAAAYWPGRLQVEWIGEAAWVFDVAHNPAGARALAAALPGLGLPRPLVLVAGILSDKEWREMLTPLAPLADEVILTVAESAPRIRRWDPGEAAGWLAGSSGVAARVVLPLEDALRAARSAAPGGTVLVTGSVYTVGDALRAMDRGGP